MDSVLNSMIEIIKCDMFYITDYQRYFILTSVTILSIAWSHLYSSDGILVMQSG